MLHTISTAIGWTIGLGFTALNIAFWLWAFSLANQEQRRGAAIIGSIVAAFVIAAGSIPYVLG